MKPQIKTNEHSSKKLKKSVSVCVYPWLVFFSLFLNACDQIKTPKPEPFLGEVAPPRKQEFRWSNGRLPKSFDPARAAASPETDVVRAIYEGLTDTDAKTLQPVPAVAVKWAAAADFKTWTFYLRRDARWSNGEPVTAHDFARSWKRLADFGAKVQSANLLTNIIGVEPPATLAVVNVEIDPPSAVSEAENFQDEKKQADKNEIPANVSVLNPKPETKAQESPKPEAKIEQKVEKEPKPAPKLGVEAVDDYTLVVTLKKPDEFFPLLVAHPIFRPVYGDGKEFETPELSVNAVTNGAFRLVSVGRDGVALERDANYWGRDAVVLERVKFVPAENAESALAAYRAGEVDAITNANFAPLALKLLAPYDDFRRTVHGALNLYEFNLRQKPFDDRRVREALAIGIERERITEDEMDGATEPALDFLPFKEGARLTQDAERARQLLAEAGFAGGAKFPTVRLLINRNDAQKRIARAVARMWKKNLNVETEVIVKDPADFEAATQKREYDVVRRGVVLPTADETVNMLAMFGASAEGEKKIEENAVVPETKPPNETILPAPDVPAGESAGVATKENPVGENSAILPSPTAGQSIFLTEADALRAIPAIPLYFPTAYSLIKPYVRGFETNALDAPSLKSVKIDGNWQPPNPKSVSNGKN